MEMLPINFHQYRIINKDFQILTRGAQGPLFVKKNQFLLLFSSGALIKMFNFHENLIMNKEFQIYLFSRVKGEWGRGGRGKDTPFNHPISLKIEQYKMLTCFRHIPKVSPKCEALE